jgi:hypothetical protein
MPHMKTVQGICPYKAIAPQRMQRRPFVSGQYFANTATSDSA